MSRFRIIWITALTFLIISTFSHCQSEKAKEEAQKKSSFENLPRPFAEKVVETVDEAEIDAKIMKKIR